jgi:hypothetical protein
MNRLPPDMHGAAGRKLWAQWRGRWRPVGDAGSSNVVVLVTWMPHRLFQRGMGNTTTKTIVCSHNANTWLKGCFSCLNSTLGWNGSRGGYRVSKRFTTNYLGSWQLSGHQPWKFAPWYIYIGRLLTAGYWWVANSVNCSQVKPSSNWKSMVDNRSTQGQLPIKRAGPMKFSRSSHLSWVDDQLSLCVRPN